MRLPDKRLGLRSELGFSLIQIIMAMGLVLLSISMYTKMDMQRLQALRSISASTRSLDVEQVIQIELENFLRQISNISGCVNYATVFAGRSIISSSGSSPISHTTNLADANAFSGLDSTQVSKALGVMTNTPATAAALSRCRHPIRPRSPTNPLANAFYFCLNFSRDANASKESFMASPRAFAEVAIEMVDITQSSTVSCTSFKNASVDQSQRLFEDQNLLRNLFDAPMALASSTRRIGAQVHLNLYWLVPTQNPYYKSRAYSFYLEKK